MAFAMQESRPTAVKGGTLTREQAREEAFSILDKFFIPKKTSTGTTYSLAGRNDAGNILLPINYAQGILDALKTAEGYPDVQSEIYDFLSSPQFRTSLEDQNGDHVLGLYAFQRILRSTNSILSDSELGLKVFDANFDVTSEFAEIKVDTEDNPKVDPESKVKAPEINVEKKNSSDYVKNAPEIAAQEPVDGPSFGDYNEPANQEAQTTIEQKVYNFDEMYIETFDIADAVTRTTSSRDALDAAMKIVFSIISTEGPKNMTNGIINGYEGESTVQATERLFLVYSNAYDATQYNGGARVAFFEELRKIRFEAHALNENRNEVYSATQQLAAKSIIDYALYAGTNAYSSGFSEVENFIPGVSTMDSKEAQTYLSEHSGIFAQASNLLGNSGKVMANPQLFEDLVNSLCVLLYSNRADAVLAAKTLANIDYGATEQGKKLKRTVAQALLFRAQDDRFDLGVRSACLYYLNYNSNFADQSNTLVNLENGGQKKFSEILKDTEEAAKSSFMMSIHMLNHSATVGIRNEQTFEDGCFVGYLEALVMMAQTDPSGFLRIELDKENNPKIPIKMGDEITAGSQYLYLHGVLSKLQSYFTEPREINSALNDAIDNIEEVFEKNKNNIR